MDPAKRLILKNLPPDVTKKEIAELIKKRSRSQPQYIDLGVNEDGTTRRYAHLTVEGLRGVIEAVNGAPIRDHFVVAEQAKPHYSFGLAEAKRKREKEEEVKQQELAELAEKVKERPYVIDKEHPPKNFFHGKRRYANVASQIAQRLREAHRQRAGEQKQRSTRIVPNSGAPAGVIRGEEATDNSGAPAKKSRAESRADFMKERKRREEERKRKGGDAPVEAPKAPEPPQPTKEERKLTGLQAKLAALREKMKK